MARLLVGLGLVTVIFTIYAVADCAFFDRERIRGLSRGWWIVVILIAPIVGGVLWFVVGRGHSQSKGSSQTRRLAPDDDVEFLQRIHDDTAHDERTRRLEQELAELDSDDEGNEGPVKHPDATDGPGEADTPGQTRA